MTIAQALRFISFAVALAISVAVMLFPFLLRHVPQTTLHTALPVLMLGAAGAMIHGIGFTPDHKLFRVLFGPATAWALVFVGAFWLLPG